MIHKSVLRVIKLDFYLYSLPFVSLIKIKHSLFNENEFSWIKHSLVKAHVGNRPDKMSHSSDSSDSIEILYDSRDQYSPISSSSSNSPSILPTQSTNHQPLTKPKKTNLPIPWFPSPQWYSCGRFPSTHFSSLSPNQHIFCCFIAATEHTPTPNISRVQVARRGKKRCSSSRCFKEKKGMREELHSAMDRVAVLERRLAQHPSELLQPTSRHIPIIRVAPRIIRPPHH